jgi:hypothetical protein
LWSNENDAVIAIGGVRALSVGLNHENHPTQHAADSPLIPPIAARLKKESFRNAIGARFDRGNQSLFVFAVGETTPAIDG